MKRVIRLVISCLVLINVFMVTAFASIPSPEVYTSVNQQSDLCNKNVKYSIGKAQSYARRGTFFDSVDVAITDKGNGDIGVTAHTYLRKPVKELYISLYLDRYNKEKDMATRLTVIYEFTLEEYQMELIIHQFQLYLKIRSVVITASESVLSLQR